MGRKEHFESSPGSEISFRRRPQGHGQFFLSLDLEEIFPKYLRISSAVIIDITKMESSSAELVSVVISCCSSSVVVRCGMAVLSIIVGVSLNNKCL